METVSNNKIQESDIMDIISHYSEIENNKDTLKWEREMNEAIAYERMMINQNKTKFCYFNPNEIISWDTKSYGVKHTYEILKLIQSDDVSCSYLVSNRLYGKNVIMKQYPKDNDFEYTVLKYIQNKYKCFKGFPCLVQNYKSERFLYLISTINVGEKYLTLGNILQNKLSNLEKSVIRKELLTLINLLLDINILHRMSLNDILLKEKKDYYSLSANQICIINFNESNCIILDKKSSSLKQYKKIYKKWLEDNILSKLN